VGLNLQTSLTAKIRLINQRRVVAEDCVTILSDSVNAIPDIMGKVARRAIVLIHVATTEGA